MVGIRGACGPFLLGVCMTSPLPGDSKNGVGRWGIRRKVGFGVMEELDEGMLCEALDGGLRG